MNMCWINIRLDNDVGAELRFNDSALGRRLEARLLIYLFSILKIKPQSEQSKNGRRKESLLSVAVNQVH